MKAATFTESIFICFMLLHGKAKEILTMYKISKKGDDLLKADHYPETSSNYKLMMMFYLTKLETKVKYSEMNDLMSPCFYHLLFTLFREHICLF